MEDIVRAGGHSTGKWETSRPVWRRPVVRFWLLPLVFALAVTAFQVFAKPLPKIPELDDYYYMFVERDLSLFGVYSDGLFSGARAYIIAPGVNEERADVKAGRFIAPGYPLLLYALARLDSGLDRSIRCHVKNAREAGAPAPDCPNAFGWLIALQTVLAGIAAFSAFIAALAISRRESVAVITLALVLLSGELSFYATTYWSEALALPGFFIFMACAAMGAKSGECRWLLGAGLALGIATLARPAYLYLLEVSGLALLAAGVLIPRYRPEWSPAWTPAWTWRAALMFILGGALPLAPWLIRNRLIFGDFEMTHGYAAYALVQRVAYNMMTWREWSAAWIVWLPDIGEPLGRRLFGVELVERLGFFAPSSYYQQGWNDFRTKTLDAAGGIDAHLGYLIRTYIVGDAVKHMLVTLPLAVRGLWVAKLLALPALVLLWPVLQRLQRAKCLALFLVLLFPPLFMVGLNAFVAISIERYNVPMLVVYAFIVAWFLADIVESRWPALRTQRVGH